ncbi:MAG: DUF1653 domain-containing protein [Deltaproteobacteria bacterium]|jgi:hypothetical protein|nr:MAG: DUF1653 domain-containing protein [Deltaproteobacteria bacterium]
MKIVKNGLYQHYKGMNYLLIDVVRHSETLEEMVLYKCLYENDLGVLWVRPLDMFIEDVTIDGVVQPRFKYIGDHKGKDRL